MLSVLYLYISLQNSVEIVGSEQFPTDSVPVLCWKIMIAFRHASGFENRVVRVRDIFIEQYLQKMLREKQIKIDGHDNSLFAAIVYWITLERTLNHKAYVM